MSDFETLPVGTRDELERLRAERDRFQRGLDALGLAIANQ